MVCLGAAFCYTLTIGQLYIMINLRCVKNPRDHILSF